MKKMKKDGQRRVDKLMRLHYDNRAVVKLVADTVLLIICCLYLARLRIEKSGVIPFSLSLSFLLPLQNPVHFLPQRLWTRGHKEKQTEAKRQRQSRVGPIKPSESHNCLVISWHAPGPGEKKAISSRRLSSPSHVHFRVGCSACNWR